jgi:hypothetical protein
MMQSTGQTESSTTTATITTSSCANARDAEEHVSEEMIFYCCQQGDLVILKLWTYLGVRVLFSEAPLVYMAGYRQVNIVRYLVNELGADVDQNSSNDLTALRIAARIGCLPLLRCLAKELGANVNQANGYGLTSLYIAAQEGLLDVVCCLVNELGADVNQVNANGATSLYIAAMNDHLSVVKYLAKELGADVHQTYCTVTPLLFAALYGKLGVVKSLLVEGGASVEDRCSPQRHTIWDVLKFEDAVDAELTSLLKVMVLLANAPTKFIAAASRCLRQQLRTQLPAY